MDPPEVRKAALPGIGISCDTAKTPTMIYDETTFAELDRMWDEAFTGPAGPQPWITSPLSGLFGAVREAWKWGFGNRLERQRKYAKLGTTAIEVLDEHEEFYSHVSEYEDAEGEWDNAYDYSFPISKGDTRKTLRFAAVVAREVRIKMGPRPTYSVANEKVAWELAAKVMEERCVRKVDRMRFLPYATKLVFIPTSHDAHAAQLGESAAVAWRLHIARPAKPWWWWRPWWGLSGLGMPKSG